MHYWNENLILSFDHLSLRVLPEDFCCAISTLVKRMIVELIDLSRRQLKPNSGRVSKVVCKYKADAQVRSRCFSNFQTNNFFSRLFLFCSISIFSLTPSSFFVHLVSNRHEKLVLFILFYTFLSKLSGFAAPIFR